MSRLQTGSKLTRAVRAAFAENDIDVSVCSAI